MTTKDLKEVMHEKQSFLCICLGPSTESVAHQKKYLRVRSQFGLDKHVIDQTYHACLAYKLKLGSYLTGGVKGFASLEKTVKYIRALDPKIFIILDANLGENDRLAAYEYMTGLFSLGFDAISINPEISDDALYTYPFIDNGKCICPVLTNNLWDDEDNFRSTLTDNILNHVLWDNFIPIVNTDPEKFIKIRQALPEAMIIVSEHQGRYGTVMDIVPQLLFENDIHCLICYDPLRMEVSNGWGHLKKHSLVGLSYTSNEYIKEYIIPRIKDEMIAILDVVKNYSGDEIHEHGGIIELLRYAE
jgi:orotidine-5'-phosphate decarboxylase